MGAGYSPGGFDNMGATTTVATTPGTLVSPPSGSLHQYITIPGAASTLVSLLSGGVLPSLSPNPASPTGRVYDFGFVDLQVEDEGIFVRWTQDGNTNPTATLGFILAPTQFFRIPEHPSKIRLISLGAAVHANVYLGISGTVGY